MKKYTIEERVRGRVWLLKFEENNAKGEKLLVELSRCENPGIKNSLPELWKKAGYTDRVLETYWSIDTDIEDTEGNHWIAYDPSIKRSDDGQRSVINFDWMMEATEDNAEKLIKEVYRLFMSAKGMTATQEKHYKVKAHGKKYNIDVVEKIPEGFFKSPMATDPIGAVSIINKKLSLESLHDGTCRRKLLLV